MRQFIRARFLALVVILSVVALVAAACAGDAGSQGPQGSAGAAGDRGGVGLQGVAGPSGSQGPVGASGADGRVGPNGADGTSGADGVDGAAIASAATVIGGSTLFDFPFGIAVSGDTLQVWGSGFNAGESVLIKVGSTSIPGGSAEANSDGAFSVMTGALPGSVLPGVYSLWAVGDEGTMVSHPLKVVDKIK
jgi:hypothetical protein